MTHWDTASGTCMQAWRAGSKVSPPSARCWRGGGDEFAVVLNPIGSPTRLLLLQTPSSKRCICQYEIDGYQIRTGNSIGMALRSH